MLLPAPQTEAELSLLSADSLAARGRSQHPATILEEASGMVEGGYAAGSSSAALAAPSRSTSYLDRTLQPAGDGGPAVRKVRSSPGRGAPVDVGCDAAEEAVGRLSSLLEAIVNLLAGRAGWVILSGLAGWIAVDRPGIHAYCHLLSASPPAWVYSTRRQQHAAGSGSQAQRQAT